jgi:hypothetical protein
MWSALATAAAISAYFASITGLSAVSLVWLFAPVLIGAIFFDTGAASRRVACRVISAVIGLGAFMFEPLGLLYLVPSVILLSASIVRPRPVPDTGGL